MRLHGGGIDVIDPDFRQELIEINVGPMCHNKSLLPGNREPRHWINHANSANMVFMQAYVRREKNWDRVTRRVDERAPTVVGGSGVASAEGKKN